MISDRITLYEFEANTGGDKDKQRFLTKHEVRAWLYDRRHSGLPLPDLETIKVELMLKRPNCD